MRENPYHNRPDGMHSYGYAEFARSYGEILSTLDLPPDSTVLEFGAGAGEEAEFIRKKTGATVFELDTSLAAYKTNPSPERGFVVADYTALPYADNTFSLIHTKDALVHIKDKHALFAEFKRVLKSDGLLLLTTEAAASFTEYMEAALTTAARILVPNSVFKHYFPPSEKGLKMAIARAGFKIRESTNWKPRRREYNWYDARRVVLFLEKQGE